MPTSRKTSVKSTSRKTNHSANTQLYFHDYTTRAEWEEKYPFVQSYYFSNPTPQFHHWKQPSTSAEKGFVLGFILGSAIMMFIMMRFFLF